MANRVHIFNTQTRGGLVELTHNTAACLAPALNKKKSKKPIIITVDGTSDAGKSLIWDEMITKLLGDTKHKTEDFYTGPAINENRFPDRSFEIWEGTNQLSEKPNLKIMVCNAASAPTQIPALNYLLDRYLSQKTGDNLPISNIITLGDVLIVSNRTSEMSELHIELEKADKFPKQEWDRVVGILPNHVIGRSKPYKALIRGATHSISPGASLQ